MERPPFPIAIDSTLRAAFVSCPRKFELEYLHHWKQTRMSIHLRAGAAFARGLEVSRIAFWQNKHSAPDAIGLGAIALVKSYGTIEEPNESDKSLVNMLGALCEYFLQYGFHTDSIQPLFLNGKPCVECSFAIEIPGTVHPETNDPILYSGRFDLLGLYNNQLFVVDEKTASQLGPSWYNNWTLRSQITGYCWAAQEFNHPVVGAIIRGLAILKRDYKHAEAIESRTKFEIDRWLFQLKRDINRMVECWKEGYFDYNLDASCANYGGCTFLSVCKSSNPQRWLEAEYVQRIWDPLTREEKEVAKQN